MKDGGDVENSVNGGDWVDSEDVENGRDGVYSGEVKDVVKMV